MKINSETYKKVIKKIAIKYGKKGRWFRKYLKKEQLKNKDREIQIKTVFKYKPKISIVVPLYNTKEIYFKELIESINIQTYKNIELCLADGSDEKLDYLEKYLNERVKYIHLDKNEGIVGNTNQALRLATGDFIAFMDHDDKIKENCMYEVVKAINENPNAEFIYTDDDKIIDETNKEIDPQFKLNFSKDMLYANNYICHLTILKKDLVDKIGFLNEKYEGAQDYDYILRAVEKVEDEKNIIHIPKILYNWRINANSVASNPETKPYAYENGKKVLEDYFERNDINAKVEKLEIPGLYRVKYINNNEKVTIIVKDVATKKELENCIKSIKESSYENHEILILSNNNYEEEKKLVKSAKGKYIVFLDSDVIVKKHTVEEMTSIFVREEIGVVGAKVISKNEKIYQIGRTISNSGKIINIYQGNSSDAPGYMGRLVINQNVLITSNKIYAIKKEDYLKNVQQEDDDNIRHIKLCIDLYKQNKLNVYIAEATAITTENKTKSTKRENEVLKIWKSDIGEKDPYLNFNYNIY